MMGAGRRQGGAVVIEFALVFVLFFMLMYAMVAYGLVFAIKHSLVQSANEGARAAVRDVGGLPERMALAETVAAESLAWLGARAPAPQVTAAACTGTPYMCVDVLISYDYAANPLVPGLPAMGIVLPERLEGRAKVQLDAVY
ncbi:TadE/TadG family type IV pilus assembly protein [Azonexus hydrophilus]|uniref:TadE/TadG family type IV pilus assembly protein n=1 Tax=Azonexus hydrophilus TaxID=418702 RepID=UPI00041B8847|nr:TadE/TadG family type IV pilus assembly protein [Azonexus hydrophilus]